MCTILITASGGFVGELEERRRRCKSKVKMNDYSVNNEKKHFAGTEQKLRERTPAEVRLQTDEY